MKKRKNLATKTKSKKKYKIVDLTVEDEIKELKKVKKESAGKVFEVEKILHQKKVKQKTFYLVKWVGWDSRYNEWVDEKGVK